MPQADMVWSAHLVGNYHHPSQKDLHQNAGKKKNGGTEINIT
jgi:hypothetical protein